ncbi:NAD(+) diphosphatase [Propionibacteriaceae bacterium Y2011]
MLDRSDEHRGSAEWIKSLWYAEDARLIKVTADGLLATNAEGTRLKMTRPFVEYDVERHILLGLVDQSPVFVVEAVLDPPVHSLRQVGAQLDDLERELATVATSITNYHRLEPMCPGCGGPTHMINGGFSRECRRCKRIHFPRTDPAVIVAVVDEQDRLLLARDATWGETRVSVLAGFVESGESFEQALHREIAEEVDIDLAATHYVGSQPWPYPRSIMIGFFARAASSTISVDGSEIVYADWFTRDQLDTALAEGTVALPSPASIAHRLITAWREGRTPFS